MSDSERYHPTGRTANALVADVEQALRAGRLQPGSALPTVRAAARQAGVSPATVAAAYRALRERGLLRTDGRRGTRVGLRPPVAAPAAPALPAHLRNLASGNPDAALLPDWRGALVKAGAQCRLYGEPARQSGLMRLAARALAADGLPTEALTVVAGALDGVERVLLAHLRPGDRVAVEDPGYSAVLDLVAALGLVAEPVTLDDFGMQPEALARALRQGTQACIVTPRAQNPSGAAFDARRARALEAVLARHPDVLLIEDDHAGPVAGVPALTLIEARRARWAVVRSVSKWLGPDLRLAVLAADPTTTARVEGRQALGYGWVSGLLQGTVAALWSDAKVQRGLRRAAQTYNARRLALIEALQARGVASQGRSGLNVWIPVPDETAMVTALAAHGWAVRAGARYRLQSGPAVRVTIASLEPHEAARLADDVWRALRPSGLTALA
jgi:DNA-binding transcriptional MocR family regulator